ncbi:intradiol ring-cleavage dioxygenase [Novosphingobium sp. G106]|uniref:intradiol ring-cleavage dioxygenase n=1 Tax=Novosphingobium sp. G106 TaxID=2849500 RepID=UPI001C2D0271|nr:intradiol ring-cleavage dioxygenase [Novosphingobium sp. G106]MBV1688173.1 intradiol ring-cleavage dioxygenase [Novosphingobium sp. G106]
MKEFGGHDRGLRQDLLALDKLLARRRALGQLGAVGTSALVAACGGDGSSSSASTGTTATPTPTPSATATATPTPTASATSASCGTAAGETAGPYPGDGTNSSNGITSNALVASGIVRSDIRSSFINSTTTAQGVQLTVTLTLANVNNGCAPLAGYAVYLWHCDREGEYSLYGLPTESYLRGVQVTDSNGQVTFTTIFPGCYSGRYPHIHFEVFSSLANATSGRYAVLTSQLALPAAACSAVYATSAYSSSATNYSRVSISSDGIFGDNTTAQMAVMTPATTGSVAGGYTSTTTIGIAT